MTDSSATAVTFSAPSVPDQVKDGTRPHFRKKPHTGNRPVVVAPRNPDKIIRRIKSLVADNYNAHRDSDKLPELTPNQVKVTDFATMGDDWCAMAESSLVHGLLYRISYEARKSVASIDVLKRINNVIIHD